MADTPSAASGPLPRSRHPLAGRWIEARDPDRALLLRRLEAAENRVVDLELELHDTRQAAADTRKRLADYQRAQQDGDGACVGCLGHRRTIADYEAAARADRARIRDLERTLRAVGVRPAPTPKPLPRARPMPPAGAPPNNRNERRERPG